MKRIYSLGLAVLTLLAVSCVKENGLAPVENPEANGNYTIVAEIENDVDTRTTVEKVEGTKQYRVLWAEGDQLSVITNAYNNAPFALTDGDGTSKGVFTGDLSEGENAFYAIYPYNAKHDLIEEMTLHLPSEYGSVDKEYTPNTNALMLAMAGAAPSEATEAPKMFFSHLGGVLCLDLKGIPANTKGVVLTANKGITGDLAMSMDEDHNSVVKSTDPTESNNSVTINFKPVDKLRSEIFYIPLPVGTYKFKVEYIGADDAKTTIVDSDRDNEVKRASLLTMPELVVETVNISFSDVTSVDAKIKIDIAPDAGEFLYYIQSLGADFYAQDAEAQQAQIDAQISSTTSTSDELAKEGYEGSFLNFYRDYYLPTASFTPGHTIFVGVIPKDNKSANAVVYELVTFDGYKLDEESAASVTFGTPTENYTTVSVRITPAAGTYFRFNYMDYDQYLAEYEGNDEKLMKFAVGTASTNGEKKNATTASPYPVEMGKSYMVVVYAYDPTTAKGKLFTKKLTCPAIEYNEAISLSLDVRYTGVNYAEVEIVPTGGEISSIRYAFMKKADYDKNTTLKQDLKIVEEKMVINQTVSNRRNFNTANLAADNVYKLENLYLNEPDQYLFVIAFDADGKAVHMVNTTIDTSVPFNNGFSADLVKPTVKEVYYISGNSAGYKKELTDWSKMSEVTDVTKLDNLTGMYWLDLDWSATGKTVKRMWLSSENHNNWSASTYPITGTDMKADAISVLKKRAGYTASGVAPDFYGLNATTGALSLADAKVWNTSEYKTLRDKTATPIGPKTIHLVWETTDGDYGYMPVVPEDFAKVDSGEGEGEGEGGEPETPVDPLASTPWGKCWLWQEEGMAASFTYMMLDLGKTTPNTVYLSMGQPDEDMESMIFTKIANYTCSGAPTVKTSNGETYLMWEDQMGTEYRVYFSGLQGGDATIWSPTTGAYDGVGIETSKAMKTDELIGLPPFTYVEGGVSQ